MKKSELRDLYEMNKDASMISLTMKKFGVVNETIISSDVADKINYILGSYDGNLRLKSCKEISIERVEFMNAEHIGTMSFGNAIDMCINGHKISRKGWNGKDQFVYFVPSNEYEALTKAAKSIAVDGMVRYNPYFALKTVSGNISTWVASVTDTLATDWYIVE